MKQHLFLLIALFSFLVFTACEESTDSTEAETPKETSGDAGNETNEARATSPLARKITKYKTSPENETGSLLSVENFNEQGKITELINYDFYGSGTEESRTTYEYDEQGNQVKMSDGNTTDTKEYDAEGRIVKTSWSRKGGDGASEERYYDERGNELQVKYYTSKGEYDFSRVYLRKYDDQDRIIEERRTEVYNDDSPDLEMYFISQEFDANDNLTVKNHHRSNGTVYNQEKLFYDKAGNLMETRTYEGEKLVGREVNEVNAFGDIIKSQTFNGLEDLQYTNLYEYDDFGNMVKMEYEHTDGDAWGERTQYVHWE